MLQFYSLTVVYCARSGLNILLVVDFYEFSKVYLSKMIHIHTVPTSILYPLFICLQRPASSPSHIPPQVVRMRCVCYILKSYVFFLTKMNLILFKRPLFAISISIRRIVFLTKVPTTRNSLKIRFPSSKLRTN